MKIIRTNLIPQGYVAMAIWPFLLIRKNYLLNDRIFRHERIHHEQQKELLLVFFYLWYGVEYLVRLFQHRNHLEAYRNISFEAEAECNQRWCDYLKNRKRYSFLKYM